MAAKKPKKPKQKGKAGDGGAPRVVAHPRARTSIRRWRGRAGLLGLIVVTWLSIRAGVPTFDAVLRGLVGGIAAQFVAWAAGVVIWRHLVLAELAAYRVARQAADAERQAVADQRAADALAAVAAKA
jgi:hypothetical protein